MIGNMSRKKKPLVLEPTVVIVEPTELEIEQCALRLLQKTNDSKTRPKYLRNCAFRRCNKRIATHRKDTIYCGAACKQAAYRERKFELTISSKKDDASNLPPISNKVEGGGHFGLG